MRILTTPYEPQHESVVTVGNSAGDGTERPTTLLIIDAAVCKTSPSGERSTYV